MMDLPSPMTPLHHARRLALVFLLPTLGCGLLRPGPPGPEVRTRVVLLGTGTPNVDPERSGPALAIVVDQTAYLVDVGAGVVVRADAAYRRGIEALRVDRIRHAFVTHLHTDHTLGLPDLVFSPWVLERDQPLQLFGPPGLRSMVDHVQQAWSEDVRIRLEGLEPANTEGYKTVVHEFESGLVHKDELVTVHAFRVPHGSFRYALGYRFETPDRVIVVSGDTAPSEALIEAAKDCDVLVHEVYSAVSYQTRPDVWKAYHASFHTSSVELAAIANRARPKLLVLTHQLFWGRTERQLLDEVREHYDGAVVSGRDLDVF